MNCSIYFSIDNQLNWMRLNLELTVYWIQSENWSFPTTFHFQPGLAKLWKIFISLLSIRIVWANSCETSAENVKKYILPKKTRVPINWIEYSLNLIEITREREISAFLLLCLVRTTFKILWKSFKPEFLRVLGERRSVTTSLSVIGWEWERITFF